MPSHYRNVTLGAMTLDNEPIPRGIDGQGWLISLNCELPTGARGILCWQESDCTKGEAVAHFLACMEGMSTADPSSVTCQIIDL